MSAGGPPQGANSVRFGDNAAPDLTNGAASAGGV